ncbi:MAG TPA: glycoside hydrolase family 16 protein, partial [Chitinophagaceae bacterium]|nr:glycoside hydrolase family 16 protein [Chitinophagaceae bacterium]
MIRLNVIVPCALLILSFCSKKSSGGGSVISIQPPVDKNWKFETTPAWSDEFDYTGLPNSAKWGYDIGGSGWGNNELEYYTNLESNAKVENGVLTITARKENMGNRNYSSARLVTKDKGDFLYGRVEVRAKLPSGRGTWPAIWMLPTDWAYGDW